MANADSRATLLPSGKLGAGKAAGARWGCQNTRRGHVRSSGSACRSLWVTFPYLRAQASIL